MSGALTNSSRRVWQDSAGAAARCLCDVRWPGVTLTVKDQDISNLTTWKLESNRHIAVVHLHGAIHRLETELEGTGAILHPPMNGEVWVIPAQARYASLAQGAVVRYAELFLDPEVLSTLTGDRVTVPSIRPRAGHYDEHFYRTVQRLYFLVRQPGDLARMEAEALSRAIYLHFFRVYSAGPLALKRSPSIPQFRPREKRLIEEYVDDHLGSAIALADLARLLGCTVHQLLSAFRGTFGTTPAQYVIERRLRMARNLLIRSSCDITSIALETGFSSHAHLTMTFKNRVGITPSEFRDSARGNG